MVSIAGIKFRECSPVYYFSAASLALSENDWVVVNTDEGQGMGYVALLTDQIPLKLKDEELKEVQRKATEEDMEIAKDNSRMGYEALKYCRERIVERGLEMKLIDVDVYFDRSKMVFFFAAPGRVDFRDLVKDLVKEYKTRIELRQIGVRHETQMIGAVGNCGQTCCCRRFLRKFDPVTIKMAKDQNLFLNPAKISGVCGRLLCCLAYEQDNYCNFKKKLPRIGKRYNTQRGIFRVLRSNMFQDSLTVLDEEGQERDISLDEWREIVHSQCTGNEDLKNVDVARKNEKKGQDPVVTGKGNKKNRPPETAAKSVKAGKESGSEAGKSPAKNDKKKKKPAKAVSGKKKYKPRKKGSKNKAQTGGKS
ncbi:MAG: regulatory iron-sulfur-containing complex subunit RicT [Desulfovibrionales bacterium]